MLSISLTSPPARENGPDFGITMHASRMFRKLHLSLQVQLVPGEILLVTLR